MEKPSDQGAFSVVYASSRRKTEEIHIEVIIFFSHVKYRGELEIALFFAVFHRCFRPLIISPGTAFGYAGCSYLCDHFVYVRCI